MSEEQKYRDLSPQELTSNLLVDFCCMDKTEFTLEESAAYHGIQVEWYDLAEVRELALKGYFEIIEEEN